MPISATSYLERQRKFRARLRRGGMDFFLVTMGVNVRYLTGFKGTFGCLLAVPGKFYLFTDDRYVVKAERTVRHADVERVTGATLHRRIREAALDHGAKALWFEPAGVTFEEYRRMKRVMRGLKLKVGEDAAGAVRAIKSDEEVRLIREACRVLDGGFRFLLDAIKPGKRERDVRAELEAFLAGSGVESLSFEAIVASGATAAAAHADATNKRITRGEFVMVDFGVCVEGYHSDMTRTVCVGKAAADDRRTYGAVRAAQRAARERSRPGAAASAPDRAARDVLGKRALERFFTHGLGHGVGMEVHEAPRLARGSGGRLREGMVFTVEPGVYIKDRLGIRIEDTGVLTKEGFVPLTRSPRGLIEL
ncbi:MAG: Xaa-Pro peptidase family protein [bacterium]